MVVAPQHAVVHVKVDVDKTAHQIVAAIVKPVALGAAIEHVVVAEAGARIVA